MKTSPAERATAAVRSLAPYQPGKPIGELERELGIRDIVKLASNENPLGPSPAALQAMRAAAADCWLYPDGSGFELKSLLEGALGTNTAQITLGNGSNDLLVMLAECFLQPGTSAVVSQYAFAVYGTAVQATGAELRTAAALPRQHKQAPLGHDLDAMRALIDASTRLVYLANPNNPTGTQLPIDALQRFIADVPSDCVVVLDEAYFEYAQGRGGSDGIAWLAQFPNLVVVRTFSKAYGLAGLRVGYAVSQNDIAAILNRVRQPFNVSSLALVAAAAAWRDRAHLSRSVEVVHAGLTQLAAGLSALRLRHIPSTGNFLLVEFGSNAMSVYQRLLRDGIIVRPVANYGLPDWLRITIGTPEQNERLLRSLRQ